MGVERQGCKISIALWVFQRNSGDSLEHDHGVMCAEKSKKKRLEKEAAVGEAEDQSGAPAVSKKPAAAPPKGAKKARRRLGCSKCRYLVNGCAVCRKKAKLAKG